MSTTTKAKKSAKAKKRTAKMLAKELEGHLDLRWKPDECGVDARLSRAVWIRVYEEGTFGPGVYARVALRGVTIGGAHPTEAMPATEIVDLALERAWTFLGEQLKAMEARP